MRMTLYELTDDYMRLLDMMGDPELDPEVLKDTMEGIEGALEDKADGYAKVIKTVEGEKAAIKAEMDRLKARLTALDNSETRLKENLQQSMMMTGKVKFKTNLFSFGIQKNAPSVVLDIVDMEDLPEKFLRFRDPEVDKTKIKEAIKAGEDLTGIAHLEQTESLRIR